MQFGLVWLTLKIKAEPNQTNAVWIESVGAIFLRRYHFLFPTLKSS